METMSEVLEGRATSDVLEPLVTDLPEMVDAVVPEAHQDDAIMLVIDRVGSLFEPSIRSTRFRRRSASSMITSV